MNPLNLDKRCARWERDRVRVPPTSRSGLHDAQITSPTDVHVAE